MDTQIIISMAYNLYLKKNFMMKKLEKGNFTITFNNASSH